MDERAPAAASRCEPVGGHRDHGIEVVAREPFERPRAPYQGEQFVLAVRTRGGFRHYLLRQDVERRLLCDDRVQLPSAHRPQQRRALHEIVPRHGKQAAFRYAGDRVAGPSDSLEKCRDPVG